MKKSRYLIMVIALVSIAVIVYGYSILNDPTHTTSAQMMDGMDMLGTMQMMSQAPEDVIIKVHSSQIVYQDEKAEIVLLVLDKTSNLPLEDAQVLIGIEKGASMTMNMQGGMSKVESRGNGHFLVSFTPSEKGIYTLHIHVIPEGKTMHSMMENHMDVGLISK